MTQLILRETFRDSSFSTDVQNAIVSAIKMLEFEQLWLFETSAQLSLVGDGLTNSVNLPADFSSMASVRLLDDTTYYTQDSGFRGITSNEMQTIQRTTSQVGLPFCWALFENTIQVYPYPGDATTYILDIQYFRNDGGVYPSNPSDTSIWFGDLTQDLTRYLAKSIFYGDTLQDEANSGANYNKYTTVLGRLRTRNSQRQQTNTLSI